MNLQELRVQFPAALEYLTQIFLIERDHGEVHNARLADRLEVSRPAVSQAVGRLKKLNLVEQDRYGVIGLTGEGRLFARKVVRRHFLLEHLLVRLLGYTWDKSDEEAERLQEALSDELADHLDERLGRPSTCPHGNPMPGSDLEQHYLEAPDLAEAPEGGKIRMIRITEEGEMTGGLLAFCQQEGLSPGRELTLRGRDEETLFFDVEGKPVSIPAGYARFIRWETI